MEGKWQGWASGPCEGQSSDRGGEWAGGRHLLELLSLPPTPVISAA